MSKFLSFIIFIAIITLCLIVFFEFENAMSKEHKILTIKTIPTSLKAINQTSITSLVSNTQTLGNMTSIHLINGMIFSLPKTDIKSGDSIQFNATVFRPVCSFIISSNSTLKELNNTIAIIHVITDHKCDPEITVIQIDSWKSFNQK